MPIEFSDGGDLERERERGTRRVEREKGSAEIELEEPLMLIAIYLSSETDRSGLKGTNLEMVVGTGKFFLSFFFGF